MELLCEVSVESNLLVGDVLVKAHVIELLDVIIPDFVGVLDVAGDPVGAELVDQSLDVNAVGCEELGFLFSALEGGSDFLGQVGGQSVGQGQLLVGHLSAAAEVLLVQQSGVAAITPAEAAAECLHVAQTVGVVQNVLSIL